MIKPLTHAGLSSVMLCFPSDPDFDDETKRNNKCYLIWEVSMDIILHYSASLPRTPHTYIAVSFIPICS